MAFSEEPLCLSRSPEGNFIPMLSRRKNSICLKVWFVELELKCDSRATRGMKKLLLCEKTGDRLSDGVFFFFISQDRERIFSCIKHFIR